jgi:hypothetical protein
MPSKKMGCIQKFSEPGSDGSLPDGFKEWQWGVIYTVRPQLLSPLVRGREYRIAASTRRRVAQDEEFTGYKELYRHAARMASTRLADLSCADEGEPLHSWVVSQGWLCFGEAQRTAVAGVALGVIFPNDGEPKPLGASPPDSADLMSAGGLPGVSDPRLLDEIYNEFDVRELPCAHSDVFLFSYGEYVPDHRGLSFDPFIERAEELAKAHRDRLRGPGSGPLRIVRREWMWATNPDVAVVHVYFQVQPHSTRQVEPLHTPERQPSSGNCSRGQVTVHDVLSRVASMPSIIDTAASGATYPADACQGGCFSARALSRGTTRI